MKMTDITFNEETTYYLNEIKEYFDIDRNFDSFVTCTLLGSYLTEEELSYANKYVSAVKVEKQISVPRTVLTNEESEIKYLLICVLYNLENGIINEKMKNKLQKIWNMETLNSDKELYNHMLLLCQNGAKYLCYEIKECNTKIDAMVDVLEEVMKKPLDQKYIENIKF